MRNQYTKTDMIEALEALVYQMKSNPAKVITENDRAELNTIKKELDEYFTPKY